jgi:hypothetical protein
MTKEERLREIVREEIRDALAAFCADFTAAAKASRHEPENRELTNIARVESDEPQEASFPGFANAAPAVP